MTVPVGWESKGVADLRLPLPKEDAPWPLTVAIAVDDAARTVDLEWACSFYRMVLERGLARISGIRIVFDSIRGEMFKNTFPPFQLVVIIKCSVERVKVPMLLVARSMSEIGKVNGNKPTASPTKFAPIAYRKDMT